jgi:hypothetical protein
MLWAFWYAVFIDVMCDAPSWMLDLGMGVAILSGFVLYFFIISWEVSRVLKCPASQAKGLVAFCGALPLVTPSRQFIEMGDGDHGDAPTRLLEK